MRLDVERLERLGTVTGFPLETLEKALPSPGPAIGHE